MARRLVGQGVGLGEPRLGAGDVAGDLRRRAPSSVATSAWPHSAVASSHGGRRRRTPASATPRRISVRGPGQPLGHRAAGRAMAPGPVAARPTPCGRRRAGGQRRRLRLGHRAGRWPKSAPGSRGRRRPAGRRPSRDRHPRTGPAGQVGGGCPVGPRRVVGGVVPGEVGAADELHLAGGGLVHGVEHDPGHLGRQARCRRSYGARISRPSVARVVVDRRVVPHERRPPEHPGGGRRLRRR